MDTVRVRAHESSDFRLKSIENHSKTLILQGFYGSGTEYAIEIRTPAVRFQWCFLYKYLSYNEFLRCDILDFIGLKCRKTRICKMKRQKGMNPNPRSPIWNFKFSLSDKHIPAPSALESCIATSSADGESCRRPYNHQRLCKVPVRCDICSCIIPLASWMQRMIR